MAEREPKSQGRSRVDPDTGKRILLVVGLIMQLIMMAVGLWPAAWLVMYFAPKITTPGGWVIVILGAILVFNFGYLIALLLFRLITPYPKEGRYTLKRDGPVEPVALQFMYNVLLVKARFEPPWAAMFSAVLTRVPPLGPLFTRYFGPHTSSTTIGDTINLLDPHYLEAGDHVQFGFNCTIIAHHFDNRGLMIKKVKIGDHAVVGGESTIMAGVEIGHHAIVGNRSVVKPETVIPPYEYWAGVPAKKIKDLTPEE